MFLSGTLKFDDVMNAGSDADARGIVDLQNKFQFDEPINIQFTSVQSFLLKGLKNSFSVLSRKLS